MKKAICLLLSTFLISCNLLNFSTTYAQDKNYSTSFKNAKDLLSNEDYEYLSEFIRPFIFLGNYQDVERYDKDKFDKSEILDFVFSLYLYKCSEKYSTGVEFINNSDSQVSQSTIKLDTLKQTIHEIFRVPFDLKEGETITYSDTKYTLNNGVVLREGYYAPEIMDAGSFYLTLKNIYHISNNFYLLEMETQFFEGGDNSSEKLSAIVGKNPDNKFNLLNLKNGIMQDDEVKSHINLYETSSNSSKITPTTNKLSSQASYTYLTTLNNIIDEVGIFAPEFGEDLFYEYSDIEQLSFDINQSTGLYFADLIDFDNNKTLELFCVYFISSEEYVYEIYEYTNKLNKVYTRTNSLKEDFILSLIKNNNKTYLCNNIYHKKYLDEGGFDGYSYTEYISFDNGYNTETLSTFSSNSGSNYTYNYKSSIDAKEQEISSYDAENILKNWEGEYTNIISQNFPICTTGRYTSHLTPQYNQRTINELSQKLLDNASPTYTFKECSKDFSKNEYDNITNLVQQSSKQYDTTNSTETSYTTKVKYIYDLHNNYYLVDTNQYLESINNNLANKPRKIWAIVQKTGTDYKVIKVQDQPFENQDSIKDYMKTIDNTRSLFSYIPILILVLITVGTLIYVFFRKNNFKS